MVGLKVQPSLRDIPKLVLIQLTRSFGGLQRPPIGGLVLDPVMRGISGPHRDGCLKYERALNPSVASILEDISAQQSVEI